jgi:amidophosphoribosyltransferase
VHLRIASPPVVAPCYYGIDMPTRGELIGARMPIEQIRQDLGVDSLGYLSQDGMERTVQAFGPFCTACFSNQYPAPLIDLKRREASGVSG